MSSCKHFFLSICFVLFITYPFILIPSQGVVSLTFDDGYLSHYEQVLPLLEQYEIAGTFYVTTTLLRESDSLTFDYLRKDHVVDLSQRGHEIASHSLTHRNLKNMSFIMVHKELQESKRILEDLIQSSVVSFAPPYGSFNVFFMHLLKKYYHSSRTIISGFNERGGALNRYFIRGQVIFNTTHLSEVERWIDQAVKEDKWLVLVYHQIVDDSTHFEKIDPTSPEEIVTIGLKTFEEHLKMIKNRNIRTERVRDVLLNFH